VLQELYDERTAERCAIAISEIHESFSFVACLFLRVCIVLDGLDEVPIKEREDILPHLKTLIRCASSLPVFLLLASRLEPDIKHIFESERSLRLNRYKISKDIEMYVLTAIDQYSRLRTLKRSFKDELVCTIVRRAKRMCLSVTQITKIHAELLTGFDGRGAN
jgi:hypothetical protein